MPLSEEDVSILGQLIYSDIQNDQNNRQMWPNFLSHYTSIGSLERIVQSEELWFSNPLFMNDLEEVRFGIIEGLAILRESNSIRAALDIEEKFFHFLRSIDHLQTIFEEKQLLDTYVFCLCEHDEGNSDGMLSMWRGYGGNGSGAAIVFDVSRIPNTPESPFVFSRVHYGTAEERKDWVRKLTDNVADFILKHDVDENDIYVIAHFIFSRLLLFALFSKHKGFSEEREWRIVYMPDRDESAKMHPYFHYQNGPYGVQPKLRLPLKPIEGVTSDNLSIDEVVYQILLGPSSSSPLSKRSIERMLTLLGKSSLVSKVVASTIPFRGR